MKLLTGSEKILQTKYNVLNFWKWAYSDIFSNRNRSVFGEFLVACALDLLQTHRVEWASVDLIYKSLKIEVKTSSYLQNWNQYKLSEIRFDISCKRQLDDDTNKYSEIAIRCADVYVFCLFTEIDKDTVNVLNTEKWDFYVIATSKLDDLFKQAKTISLAKLKTISTAVNLQHLKSEIDYYL